MDPEKSHVFQLLFILADGLILPVLIACCMNQAASVVRLDIDDILDIFKDSLPIAADSQPFYSRPIRWRFSTGCSIRLGHASAEHFLQALPVKGFHNIVFHSQFE